MFPHLIGILNITPDSFSDGNQFFTPDAALTQARQLIEEGTSIIDVGAESTRPGATPLSHREEWQRLSPILPELVKLPVKVSLDSRHPETVAKALALGVAIINDVSGLENPAMLKAVKTSSCQVVLMHNLGVPANKQITLPEDSDPVALIIAWAKSRIAACGIAKERLIFDPGIGFGKTAQQSWEIIQRIEEFRVLGLPLLVGHSRKSFLGTVKENNDIATFEISVHLAKAGVEYLRVHNVAGNRHAIEG